MQINIIVIRRKTTCFSQAGSTLSKRQMLVLQALAKTRQAVTGYTLQVLLTAVHDERALKSHGR